jgi:hypothetical protein
MCCHMLVASLQSRESALGTAPVPGWRMHAMRMPWPTPASGAGAGTPAHHVHLPLPWAEGLLPPSLDPLPALRDALPAHLACSSPPNPDMTSRGGLLKAWGGMRGLAWAACTSRMRPYPWILNVRVGPCGGAGRGRVGCMQRSLAGGGGCSAGMAGGSRPAARGRPTAGKAVCAPAAQPHPGRLGDPQVAVVVGGGQHDEVGDAQRAGHGDKVLQAVALRLLQVDCRVGQQHAPHVLLQVHQEGLRASAWGGGVMPGRRWVCRGSVGGWVVGPPALNAHAMRRRLTPCRPLRKTKVRGSCFCATASPSSRCVRFFFCGDAGAQHGVPSSPLPCGAHRRRSLTRRVFPMAYRFPRHGLRGVGTRLAGVAVWFTFGKAAVQNTRLITTARTLVSCVHPAAAHL